MLRKILLWAGIVLLSISICGCVSTGVKKITGSSQEEGLHIKLPDRTIDDIKKQPAHFKFVLAAIVNKIRGDRDRIPEVKFDSKGKHLIDNPDFTYNEFSLTRTQITGFRILEQDKTDARLILEGLLTFTDLFGRGATNYFAVDYTVHPKGILINNSGTALIAPSIPYVETYMVPKASFDDISMENITSFMDLYVHAITKALKMEPTQEERQSKEAFEKLSFFKKISATDREKGEYYIMAFCKDRLPPEASLKMKVTDQAEGRGNELMEPGYIYDQGWRVIIAGGTFIPDSLKAPFHITLKYNIDPESRPRDVCIGTYSNQKNYTDRPRFIIKDDKQTSNMSQAGDIESGSIFLNPKDKSDAKVIQSRLSGIGFYKKKIDGDFGSGSINALKSFKKSKGLADNGNWDLKTQKLLFKGSGL